VIGTVAELKTYAADRGITDVAGATDPLATQALVRASDYITYHYVPRFREGFDETSPLVEPAVYEAAILEFRSPNFFNTSFTPNQQKVLVGVGDSIRWEVVEGGGGGTGAATPVSTRIEAMLWPYLIPNVSAVLVV
jgi:hypothetical protein